MKEQDYIYEIYLEKSFSKAAKKLFVSQPALSMAVKKAEDRLGITIFDRNTAPLNLTDAGKIYIEAIEEMRSIEKSMIDRLTDMENLEFGKVIVSGENFVSSFILPEVLLEFSKKYKGIEVELVESNSPDLRQLLLNESIDILVAHDFDPNLYESKDLFEEQVLLAVPKDFEINKTLTKYALTVDDIKNGKHKAKATVDFSKFENEEFLLLKSGNDMNKRASRLCEESGFEPKAKIYLDQLITAYNLACAGMGITFVTDILVEKATTEGCVYYSLKGKSAYRKMRIGYKKNKYINRAADAFVKTAVEIYQNR